MKKLIVSLFVILVLGAVVFFFGWIQFQIPATGYGVIFSKTHGWEERVVKPGDFVWRWQRLLPTNVTLYTFELEPQSTRVDVSGELPSASVYSSVLEEGSRFSYAVQLEIVYRVEPDALPALAEELALRPETLSDLYTELLGRMRQRAGDVVLRLMESSPEEMSGAHAFSMIVDAVSSDLRASFDALEIQAVSPSRIVLPDVLLYARAKELYLTVMETRAAALRDAAKSTALVQAETERDLALLERYGEILDRYPVLLEYFRMGLDLRSDPLDLESLIPRTGA